jgi:hypothetical protein
MSRSCVLTCPGECPVRQRALDCLPGRGCYHTAHLSGAGESHRWVLEIARRPRLLGLHLDPAGTLWAAIRPAEEAS